jgi:hypothetical protein
MGWRGAVFRSTNQDTKSGAGTSASRVDADVADFDADGGYAA